MAKFIKRYRYPYLFIMPFFILFLVFQLVPNIWTMYISLTEWNGIGAPRFTGVQNYKMLFKDYMFWDALKNTIIYWVTGVVLILALALLISGLLNYSRIKGKAFFKSATYLPNICAVIAMGIIFSMLFEKNTGLVNEIIFSMGGTKVDWLTGTKFSKLPVIALNVWRNTPWFTMILLSGLLNISPEYYEAAKVDGANAFQRFFKITLPALSNVMFFCFITLTADSWKIFNEPYMLQGPGTSNVSLFQYMYESGFNVFKLGYASTIGCMLTFILLIVSIVQFIIRMKQGEV